MNIQELGGLALDGPDFSKKLARAKDFARQAFNSCKNPYLAMSGGKDSVAMAGIVNDVANEMGRDFVMWAHVSDASFPGTEETIDEVSRVTGRKIIYSRSTGAFEALKKAPVDVVQFGKKGVFFESIAEFATSGAYDLAFVGVRADESKRRERAVRVHGYQFNTTVPVKQIISYPVAYFKTSDVAAAIIYYGLPFHPIYMKWHQNPLKIRLGYVSARDLLNFGTAVFIKKNYPDIFRRIAAVWPDIKSYA